MNERRRVCFDHERKRAARPAVRPRANAGRQPRRARARGRRVRVPGGGARDPAGDVPRTMVTGSSPLHLLCIYPV